MMRFSYRGIRLGLVLIPAVLLVACGGLESPVGDVDGRIIGATAGAYAYPFGQPGLKVPLVVDAAGVGTFTFRDLPTTSTTAIVLYDGAPAPYGRAELVPVAVEGGRVNRLADRYGAAATLSNELLRMPLAGTLLAAAVPDGGATAWKPTFDLPETDHGTRTPATGGSLAIYPLPAGRYALGAVLPGFVGARAAVDVAAGATTAGPVTLLVDSAATAPGCAAVSSAAPAPCENGLVCEPADGRCYECTAADATHCASRACDVATHLCKPQGAATYCSACTRDSECTAGLQGTLGICRVASGATSGYCTTSGCNGDYDCPSGFACGDSGICRPPAGCDAWIQTMGTVCYSDDHCHDALNNGYCRRTSEDAPGYCTAYCLTTAACQVGTVTQLTCTNNRCTPP